MTVSVARGAFDYVDAFSLTYFANSSSLDVFGTRTTLTDRPPGVAGFEIGGKRYESGEYGLLFSCECVQGQKNRKDQAKRSRFLERIELVLFRMRSADFGVPVSAQFILWNSKVARTALRLAVSGMYFLSLSFEVLQDRGDDHGGLDGSGIYIVLRHEDCARRHHTPSCAESEGVCGETKQDRALCDLLRMSLRVLEYCMCSQ